MKRNILCIVLLLYTLLLSAQSKPIELVVIGTIVNEIPNLPTKVRIGTDEMEVVWDNLESGLFTRVFSRTIVRGRAEMNGVKTDVTASVWVLPDNLVYLIDAGRVSPSKSQIFDAAKSLRGDALLNDKPDRKYTSKSDLWGYIERGAEKDKRTYVTSGDEVDWATSYISDGNDKDAGLVYKLTLQAGVYKVTVAHVPCLKLSFASWLRVNNARINSQTVKTTIAEDKLHPPVLVTHDLKLTEPTTITYETDKLVGQFWENASISLIAVEQVSSNIAEPIMSLGGGDFWEPQQIRLTHKDEKAEIFYTLDGSKPDRNSMQFSSPIQLDETTRLKAIAYVGNESSKIVSSDFAINTWATTATEFKIAGELDVKNVKVHWMQRGDSDTYKIYRDNKLIGESKGDVFDDYDLPVGETFTYYVEAYRDGKKLATATHQEASTFSPQGEVDIYDNKKGKYVSQRKNRIHGIKIGDSYFSYKMEKIEKVEDGKQLKGWAVFESYSQTGIENWSKLREVAFYPNVNFEGIGFQFNRKTNKVVLSAHYEDLGGYEAAKIFLAQITPKGEIEIGTMDRPLGYDSRDQSLFVDNDGTAYFLSATRMNNDINIYKLDETWTKPIGLVNTVFIGQHRETPAIINKEGVYYFFSSKASGWYPSQAMYSSSTALDGVWTSLREIGNNSTFGAQSNSLGQFGTKRRTFGLWSYHWGAQYHHVDPDGNFPRVSLVTFNEGYASMDYFRYLEFHDEYGIIPVQTGRNLTLNSPVTATVAGGKAECVTDGASLNSSCYFEGGTFPYTLTIDMQQKMKISEINLSTKLVGGSETAYQYTIEGSLDGGSYTTLVDGTHNWEVGFQILDIDDQSTYRYLRLNVLRILNVHNNNSATWAEGVYEITAFGNPE